MGRRSFIRGSERHAQREVGGSLQAIDDVGRQRAPENGVQRVRVAPDSEMNGTDVVRARRRPPEAVQLLQSRRRRNEREERSVYLRGSVPDSDGNDSLQQALLPEQPDHEENLLLDLGGLRGKDRA